MNDKADLLKRITVESGKCGAPISVKYLIDNQLPVGLVGHLKGHGIDAVHVVSFTAKG